MLLPDVLELIGAQLFYLTLDVVDLGELLEREAGDLAFVHRMRVKELSPGARQAADLGHAAGDQGFVAGEVVVAATNVAFKIGWPCASPGLPAGVCE